MFHTIPTSALFFSLCLMTSQILLADGSPIDLPKPHTQKISLQQFTGRVTGKRVRLRVHPSTESDVVKELTAGELVLVKGENNGFYEIEAPTETKAYIYRTFVLDGKVEGDRVNVRLSPSLEGPIIGQLNTGAPVEGKINGHDHKWLEISPPKDTTFYIATDYVERIGDVNHIKRLDRRREEASHLLNTIYLSGRTELMKRYEDVDLRPLREMVEKIHSEYAGFDSVCAKADQFLAKINDQYLQMKIAYLESKTKDSQNLWKTRTERLAQEIESERKRVQQLEEQLSRVSEQKKQLNEWAHTSTGEQVSTKMAGWIPVEMAIYENWKKQNPGSPTHEFYEKEQAQSVALRGVIQKYDRPVRNRPGDYMLLNARNKMPIAYLYSTRVDLEKLVGEEVNLTGVIRPNNHFAYPAYFILEIE